MNNLECAVGVLASHREARRWADETVALDLLAQLGLEATDEATHAAGAVEAETDVVDDPVRDAHDPPALADIEPTPLIEADPTPTHG